LTLLKVISSLFENNGWISSTQTGDRNEQLSLAWMLCDNSIMVRVTPRNFFDVSHIMPWSNEQHCNVHTEILYWDVQLLGVR
jgi:hypothetical protein